jgi:hypothetical protein
MLLEKRYWDLWITRDLERLSQAIDAFAAREHRPPRDVAELVRSGAFAEEPLDPRGGRYRIEGGRATTDLEYSKLELNLPYRPTKPTPEVEQTFEKHIELQKKKRSAP